MQARINQNKALTSEVDDGGMGTVKCLSERNTPGGGLHVIDELCWTKSSEVQIYAQSGHCKNIKYAQLCSCYVFVLFFFPVLVGSAYLVLFVF